MRILLLVEVLLCLKVLRNDCIMECSEEWMKG